MKPAYEEKNAITLEIVPSMRALGRAPGTNVVKFYAFGNVHSVGEL